MNSSRALNPEQISSKGAQVSSQQVIWQQTEKGEIVYYLPCYVRFLVKEIKNVDVESMEAVVSGTLLFSFYYGAVPQQLLDRFVGKDAETAILLEFNQEQSIFLKEDRGITRKMDFQQRVVTFTVRQNFRANLRGNVFVTPFEVLDICLSVIVQTVHVAHSQGERGVSFKFNCMDSTEVELISHGDSVSFGYYHIATYHLNAVYSNSRKNPFNEKGCCFSQGAEGGTQEEHFFNCFQYAHFRIPIYKYPGVSMLTIFIPLWIIGLIGLFVFFQEPGFGSRLATIAVLALAFVAFLPTINATVPQTPDLKLVDVLVIMELAAVILLLVQSFQNRFSQEAVFDWQNSRLFLAALSLNIFTVATVLLLFVMHKLFWERGYTRARQAKQNRKFSRKMWSNLQCDYEFAKMSSRLKLKNI